MFVERRGRWHVVARTTVPGDEPVGAITWTPTSDAVVVAVGSNLVVLALASDGDNRGEVHSSDARANPLSNLGALAASACAALPEYHPDALVDWLVRGKTRRARRAARRALAYLRDATGTRTTEEETGPVPVAPAELLEGEAGEEETNEGEREEKTNAGARANTEAKESMASNANANANANADADAPPDFDPSAFGFGGPAPAPAPAAAPPVVPEFDADAFGGFAGFGAAAPRTGPALFTFGQDLDATTPTSTTSTTSTTATATSTRRTPRAGDDGPFSSAEAEEGAQLIASRGARLPGIDAEDRVALLGVLDALRDADGGADSATDEAGRRFNALRRGRALRRARGGGVDPHGPRGEELAWALQCDTQEALLASALDDSSGTGYGTGFRGWARLRLLGAPLWLRDDDALRALVDGAARAEFAATREPAGENPCALLFVSLGRVGVLAGLFRAVRDARLAEFFSRDFAEARHREAALKNAYALLSKHRYLFAATFFALAGQPADAAALVWKHGGDLSLAVTVARLAPAAKKDAEEPNPTRTRTDSSRDPGAKIGGDAGDDGTISMDAFANFGARKTTPETTPENVSRTSPTPPPEKEPEAEAPLPASLSPAAKTFLRAEVIPSFGVSSDATRGEDAWTLAALRWMCGDGDASVSALASVASDANASSAAAASAADLCAFIAGRRALRATRPTLARAAAAAATASAGRLVLALESAGLPLAALERCRRRRIDRGDDDGDENGDDEEKAGDVDDRQVRLARARARARDRDASRRRRARSRGDARRFGRFGRFGFVV